MMHAYINYMEAHSLTPLRKEEVSIDEYLHELNIKGWVKEGSIENKTEQLHTPVDVLKNPLQYVAEFTRIQQVDLSFPIIVFGNGIVDGLHRLCKSVLEKKSTLWVYRCNEPLMNKFKLGTEDEWTKVNAMKVCDFITLFYTRFKTIETDT